MNKWFVEDMVSSIDPQTKDSRKCFGLIVTVCCLSPTHLCLSQAVSCLCNVLLFADIISALLER